MSNLVYTNNHDVPRLLSKVTEWAQDRNIIKGSTAQVQFKKYLEESIELFATLNPELTPFQITNEIGRMVDDLYRDGRIKKAPKGKTIKDDIGDCMVVLNNLALMSDTTLEECAAHAWNDIKDRKGFMNEHGVFIKEGDNEEA